MNADGRVSVDERAPSQECGDRIIVSDGEVSAQAFIGHLYRNPKGELVAPARYGNGIVVRYWRQWPMLPGRVGEVAR